jgi:hypothetical protein
VAFALLLSGCAPGVTEDDYDDVATAVGALVANDSGGEVGSMGDGVGAALGEVPDGLTASGSGSLQGTRAGLTYEYGLTCLDESGDAMSACDPTTDSARLTVAWSGELSLPALGYSASVDRTGDWTLSGLQSDAAAFEGTGTFDVETEFQAIYRPVTRSFLLDYDAVYEGIAVDTVGRDVTAGTIEYTVHASRIRTRRSRTVEVELDVTATVTFHGTAPATIDLDGDRAYTLDLATGAVTKQ